MMDHISSQFKNELQKKFGGGSLLLSREFVTQFSAKCHHNFCVEKTLRENRNSALNHEKTFFTILWSNLENAESLK